MNSLAVYDAKERLERAIEAAEQLRVACTFKDTRRAWSAFLIAASTIYSKLEQGAKSDSRSYAWFATKKKERADDELLRYLHHACNSDEHSLAELTKEGETGEAFFSDELTGGRIFSTWWIQNSEDQVQNLLIIDPKGREHRPIRTEIKKYLAIVAVTDRGVRYDPPTAHCKIQIEIDEPLGIATLAVDYLAGLVAEAEAYISKEK